MKFAFLIAGFSLMLSHSAHALNVGDSATYLLTASGQNIEMVVTVSQINGDTYTATTTMNGVSYGATTSGSISGIAAYTAVIEECPAFGGELVTLQISSGPVNTCHIAQNGEDNYISPDVTFGIVKSVQASTGQTMTLQSFIMH